MGFDVGGGAGASLPALDLEDERVFTPHAGPGWRAWDSYSPEVEFCEFVGSLQRMLCPAVVLETGVGAGRLTSYLDLDSCTYLGYESDPEHRRPPARPDEATPEPLDMARADLVILDSAPGRRRAELDLWKAYGKPKSVCVVHDCGNGHQPGGFHDQMRRAVLDTGIPGFFTRNPRGGWVGVR